MGPTLIQGKTKRMFSAGMKIGIGSSLFAVLGAAAAAESEWHSLLKDFGFPVALVVFFVWASWTREERAERNAIEREQRITNRVTELERFNQSELVILNKSAIAAITENSAALSRLVDALDKRPCLCEGTNLIEAINLVSSKMDNVLEVAEKAAQA